MDVLIRKRLLLFFAGFIGLLMVTVREYLVGGLSPQRMGIVVVLLCVCAVIILTLLFRTFFKARESVRAPTNSIDVATRKKIVRSIRTTTIALVILPILLVYSLWDTKDEPVLLRLSVAGINLCVTYVFFLALRAQKTKLK